MLLTRNAYIARRAAWLADNDFDPASIGRKPTAIGLIGDLLDHGFVATHRPTRRRVLFGDVYSDRIPALPTLERQYGIQGRTCDGLWFPCRSILVVLWIVDPVKAARLFIPSSRQFGTLPFVQVPRPSLYLGRRMADIARKAGR